MRRKKHKLRVALQYTNRAKKGKNVGSPHSTRENVIDTFVPATITLNENTQKPFILKTKEEDKNQPLQILLDGAKEPRSGRKLIPHESCAGPEDLFIIPSSKITVEIPPAWMKLFNNKNFNVCDVGGAFEDGKPPHIDLYWDEDNPLGINSENKFIPASFKGQCSTATCQVILTKLS